MTRAKGGETIMKKFEATRRARDVRLHERVVDLEPLG